MSAHREKVTERLAAHLLDTGLSQASLRQLAQAGGVSDRMALAGVIIALVDGLALVDICSSEADMQAMHRAVAALFEPH